MKLVGNKLLKMTLESQIARMKLDAEGIRTECSIKYAVAEELDIRRMEIEKILDRLNVEEFDE